MRRKLSLAGQLLALQLGIVLLVIIAVAGVSVVQADNAFRQTEGRRLLSVAESVAANPVIQSALTDRDTLGAVPGVVEAARGVSGAAYVRVTDGGLRDLTSDDRESLNLGESTVLSGRSWTGVVDDHLVAHVPVLDLNGHLVGVVGVGQYYPSRIEQLVFALPHVLTYFVLASAVGTLGSLMLARRIRRQTLGMEPREITGLVEHREAMLHGIKEGVVGLDSDNRITLANDEAIRLLALPPDAIGKQVSDVGVDRSVRAVMSGLGAGEERSVIRDGRVLLLNRTPIMLGGVTVGSVTTLRDQTDVHLLKKEADLRRAATAALSAQSQVFANRLRAVANLINTQRQDEASQYARWVSDEHEIVSGEVRARLADLTIGALLVAKATVAAAMGIRLRLVPESHLPQLSDSLCGDIVAILDAFIDAVLASHGRTGLIDTTVQHAGNAVFLRVHGLGADRPDQLAAPPAGLPEDLAERLSDARQICVRRGGQFGVDGDPLLFSAWVPAVRS